MNAPKNIADRCDDAETRFRESAQTWNFRTEWFQPDAEEGWCRIPAQDGLAFDCTLQLVNDDDLWFGVGDFFTFPWFPFPEETPRLRELVVGFLTGEFWSRVTRGHAFLERPARQGWKNEARYPGLRWFGWRNRIVSKDGERTG